LTEEVEPGAQQGRHADETSIQGDRRLDPRASVLVVEDEHELRELIARWLESRSYRVVEAADGRDAVELLQAGLEPDVILLDLTMPRMDGRAFLEWLRPIPSTRTARSSSRAPTSRTSRPRRGAYVRQAVPPGSARARALRLVSGD
jgi:CheY-like chemotaxis protein